MPRPCTEEARPALPRALHASARDGYFVAMATGRSVISLGLLLAVLGAGRPALAVSLQATSATVSQPGDHARVCVTLNSGGQQVAGTQNDLQWDGTCATLPSESSCTGMVRGKQLSAAFPPGPDFRMRALVLSLSDVNPIPDGILYCCDFQVEADPGKCCRLVVTNAGASDPAGNALGASGNVAQLCTRSDGSGQGIGSVNGMGGNQPLSGSNVPLDGGAAGGAPAAPAAPAAARPPVSQVLSGGGAVAPTPMGANPIAPPPNQIPPTLGAATPPAAAPAAPVATPPGTAPHASAPTAAATSAATSAPQAPAPAAPADTPTHRAVVPTPPSTPVHAPTNARAAGPAPAARSGGWLGCEVAGGATATPVAAIGAAIGLVAMVRRRARRRGPKSSTH
jgi:hypothetical protein